jgi:DNA primase
MSLFDSLREQVAIEHVLGTVIGVKAHCIAPEHQDTNPSMHLYGDHVHCYGCGFHGDIVDVWGAMQGIADPIEAALNLAREYRIELPEQDPEARRKAQQLRKKEDLYLGQARACHKAFDRHPHVAEWWQERGFGEELRKKFLLGTNEDGTAVVIPFWNRGRVQGLIHRKLKGAPKYLYPNTDDFVRGYRPLFIPGSLRGDTYLVEGIVDALALAALGESSVAVGGTGLSAQQIQELERLSGSLYILPDADEEGAKAARTWARELYPKALVCPAEYGEEVEHA